MKVDSHKKSIFSIYFFIIYYGPHCSGLQNRPCDSYDAYLIHYVGTYTAHAKCFYIQYMYVGE